MTIGFSTHFPEGKGAISGKPTNFVSKIWKCIGEDDLDFDPNEAMNISMGLDEEISLKINDFKAKRHTIRRDENERWEAEKMIHPVINNRTPERFQFAPKIKCTGKERIFIVHPESNSTQFQPFVNIGGEDIFPDDPRMELLAINDGFDSVEDFFCWFDEYFEGWIIHWTGFRYNLNAINVNLK
jgi:hypothetical protein